MGEGGVFAVWSALGGRHFSVEGPIYVLALRAVWLYVSMIPMDCGCSAKTIKAFPALLHHSASFLPWEPHET